jgi:TPR repeat protein
MVGMNRAALAVLFAATLTAPLFAQATEKEIVEKCHYVWGDNDSRIDARQFCLLEAKRRILERAGSRMRTLVELENGQFTREEISSYAESILTLDILSEDHGMANGRNFTRMTVRSRIDVDLVLRALTAPAATNEIVGSPAVSDGRAALHSPSDEDVKQATSPGQGMGIENVELYCDGEVFDAKEFEDCRKLALAGRAEAQMRLGLAYLNGRVEKDNEQGLMWLHMAGKQNFIPSFRWLGALYYDGDRIPRDHSKALHWYLRAEKAGVDVSDVLGIIYFSGLDGVEKNDPKAFPYLKKAAWKAHSKSQIALADLYAKGAGVVQDSAEAFYWYSLGVARGFSELRHLRDAAFRRLSPNQKRALQARVKIGFSQSKLFDLGYYSGRIDGIDGPKTRQAIKDWKYLDDIKTNGSTIDVIFPILAAADTGSTYFGKSRIKAKGTRATNDLRGAERGDLASYHNLAEYMIYRERYKEAYFWSTAVVLTADMEPAGFMSKHYRNVAMKGRSEIELQLSRDEISIISRKASEWLNNR